MTEGFTLPIEQLERWAADLRRNESEVARLHAEREAILKKIHAVRELFGPDAVPDIPAATAAPAEEQTLIGFIADRIQEAEAGLSLTEISSALKGSALRERFVNNPNAVYTAVGRLVEREKAVRVGRLVYSPAAYARLQAGEVPNRAAKESQDTVQGMVLSALRESQKAMTSGEILDVIRARDEGQAARFAVRPQLGYNAISRLAKRGKILKDGKFYRLPGATPPDSDAQLAFD